MHNFYIIARTFFSFLLCCFFILPGCESKPGTTKEQKVISKEIVLAKPQPSAPPKTDEKASPEKKQLKKIQPENVQSKKAEPVNIKKETPPETTEQQKPKGDKEKPKEGEKEKKSLSNPPATPKKQTVIKSYVYDPIGKVDPFAPIFRDQNVTVSNKTKKESKEKRVPLTPLEKISLGQLKLVGIMLAPSGDKALVQEASGKGYVITEGTYIGTKSGRVVDILLDKIVIEEKVEDYLGNLNLRTTEMKLQKAPGD